MGCLRITYRTDLKLIRGHVGKLPREEKACRAEPKSDAVTILYYYGARYYDPAISLWLSVDPLAEQTMTPYQYVNQNPVRFIDPTGMTGEDPPNNPDNTNTISKVFNNITNKLKERYGINPEKDIKLYETREKTMEKNTQKMSVLSNFTKIGQLRNTVESVVTEWANKTGRLADADTATKIYLDLKTTLFALGVSVTSSEPRIKTVAGVISTALMAENIGLSMDNFYFLEPRIKSHSPEYYKKHIDQSYEIPDANKFFGGGSFGGAGYTSEW